MFFLIIARFRPNVYDELGMRGPQQERDFGFLRTDAQEKARKTAEQLFGAVYANVDPKFVTEEMREEAEIIEDPTTGRVTVKEKPSAGIEFTSLHAFQYSRSRPEKLGWMAIVDIANYAKLMQVLEWPTGELCQLYDMEIISLNETVANTDPTDIYTYMTPAQWGPTHGI